MTSPAPIHTTIPMRIWARLAGGVGASPFARNVAILFTGTVLGQAASVVLSPALTRLYDPAAFGVLSVYMSLLNIVAVVGALRYELAIPTATDEAEATNLLALSLGVLIATTAVVTGLAALAPAGWLDAAWLGPLDGYRALIPVGFFCIGGYFVVLYAATRLGDFAAIARTRISQGLTGPLSQIGLGLLGAGPAGLMIGFVAGQSSGIALLFRRVVLHRRAALADLSVGEIAAAAWRYRRFPLVSSWSALIDAAGTNQILFVLISALYSPAVAGYLFLIERVVGRPLLMVSTSLLQVFVAEAGRAALDDPALLRRRFRQVAARQLALSLAWVGAVNLAAAWLFGAVFGAEWAPAVPYLHVFSLAFVAQSTLHAVAHTLQILQRQGLAAAWQVGRMVAVVGGVLLAARGGADALGTLAVYCLLQTLACVILFALMAWAIDRTRPA